jgi:hypothetical protein
MLNAAEDADLAHANPRPPRFAFGNMISNRKSMAESKSDFPVSANPGVVSTISERVGKEYTGLKAI